MLPYGQAIDAYVIMDWNDAGKVVSDLVHDHMKDILSHLQAKEYVQEPVPPFVGIEGCKV